MNKRLFNDSRTRSIIIEAKSASSIHLKRKLGNSSRNIVLSLVSRPT